VTACYWEFRIRERAETPANVQQRDANDAVCHITKRLHLALALPSPQGHCAVRIA